MDAVKFLRTYRRMCRVYDVCHKPGCPMQDVNHCDLHDPELDIEKAVAAAEKWDEEHPEKTMAQDFFEKYPNAPKQENGSPTCCPWDCGYSKEKDCPEETDNCEKCWNRLLEEV